MFNFEALSVTLSFDDTSAMTPYLLRSVPVSVPEI